MIVLGPYLAAAALLVVAGVAKVRRPGDTARALAALRPGRRLGPVAVAVRVGAAAEATVGLAALALPHRPEAVAVAASYAAFAGFVVLARARGGVLATCGCFGSPDTPATRTHVVVDLALAAAAAVVAAAPPTGSIAAVLSHEPLRGGPLVACAALLAWLAAAAMSQLGRLHAVRSLLASRPADGSA